ncbi:MAG TPA: hypothetical protein VEW03_10230, partial [Longimicrobiaceae bacterium]|nr:hypothetical protein [Longimicrobiaceae bacterium]
MPAPAGAKRAGEARQAAKAAFAPLLPRLQAPGETPGRDKLCPYNRDGNPKLQGQALPLRLQQPTA